MMHHSFPVLVILAIILLISGCSKDGPRTECVTAELVLEDGSPEFQPGDKVYYDSYWWQVVEVATNRPNWCRETQRWRYVSLEPLHD